jgi:hypothetical protein
MRTTMTDAARAIGAIERLLARLSPGDRAKVLRYLGAEAATELPLEPEAQSGKQTTLEGI